MRRRREPARTGRTAGPAAGRVVTGEVRSPDARSPFVLARGTWRCETDGHVNLQISAEGEATLGVTGRILASVANGRSVVNRACERARPARPPIGDARSALGASLLRCAAPRHVLVDFRGGDVVVRAAPGGRFVAGAGVGAEHPEAGGFWSAACAPAR